MSYTRPAGDSDFDSEDEDDYYSLYDPATNTAERVVEVAETESSFVEETPMMPDDTVVAPDSNPIVIHDLQTAVSLGNVEVVRQLLESLDSPDITLKSGLPLLVHAAYFSQHAVVKLLVDYGAKIDISSSRGETALHAACKASADPECEAVLDTVTILVSAGANVDAVDFNNRTPLMYACRRNQTKVVEYLLQSEDPLKRILRKDDRNWTSVDWAAVYRNTDTLDILKSYLQEKFDIKMFQSSKLWPLHVLEHLEPKDTTLADEEIETAPEGISDDCNKGDVQSIEQKEERPASVRQCDVSSYPDVNEKREELECDILNNEPNLGNAPKSSSIDPDPGDASSMETKEAETESEEISDDCNKGDIQTIEQKEEKLISVRHQNDVSAYSDLREEREEPAFDIPDDEPFFENARNSSSIDPDPGDAASAEVKPLSNTPSPSDQEEPENCGLNQEADPEPLPDGDGVEEDEEDILPSVIKRVMRKNEYYQTYGHLELFLAGLELTHLIPLFQEQDIKFEELLCMNMDELEQMGVKAFGTRKRIAAAVKECHEKHTSSSLLPDRTKTPLTTDNIFRMMSGTSEQIKYISSCLRYIKYHIDGYPDSLYPEENVEYEQAPIQTYKDKIEDIMDSLVELATSVQDLKSHSEKLENETPTSMTLPVGMALPDDDENEKQRPSLKMKIFIGVTVLAFGVLLSRKICVIL